MITDAFTRLSDDQDVSSINAAGSLLSTHYIDTADRLGRSGSSMLGIKERAHMFANHGICATFTVTTEVTLASDPDGTMRFQLIGMPKPGAAGVAVTATTGVLKTTDGYFLPTGSVIKQSSTANGLTLNTHYYVLRDTDDPSSPEFKLSTTQDLADAVTPTGSFNLSVVPEIFADSSDIPVGRLRGRLPATGTPDGQRPGDQISLITDPRPSTRHVPLHRFVYARYIASAGVNTGAFTCDVGISVPDNRGLYYAGGYEIK